MFEQVLEMTSLNSQICLIPSEQIVKCVSRYCLHTAITARQEQRQLHDSNTASHGAECTVQGITLLRPSSLIRSHNRPVKHRVTCIYFVREYAEDFHCGNLHKKSYNCVEGMYNTVCRCFSSFALEHV
jgi:hypothetical protein